MKLTFVAVGTGLTHAFKRRIPVLATIGRGFTRQDKNDLLFHLSTFPWDLRS
jgi:hypothetical protein